MSKYGGGSRGPERLDALLGDELSLFGSAPPVPLALVKAWDAAVGEHVASRSRPSRLKGKTLHVKVANSTWMSELQMLAPSILAKLAEQRALARVEELRFELGPLPRSAADRVERPPPAPAPRRPRPDRALPAPIASALDKVGDATLRDRIAGVLDQVLDDEKEKKP